MNCSRIEADDGTKTKHQYMISAPSEVCWKDGSMQQELLPWAVLFFIIYTIGYPVLVAWILLTPASREKAQSDQFLRCMGTGSTPRTNKKYYNFRSKYSTLYFKFKPQYYYWALIIVLRKLLIVTFTLVFHINATMQLSMILLVCFLAYTLQVKYNPYMSRADYEDILGDMDQAEYDDLLKRCPQPKGIGYEHFAEENRDHLKKRRFSVTHVHFRSITRGDLKAGSEQALKFLFDY
eukprot:CAMPEP_0118997814 /NCGR_PEP_ID=MMETSP1173-20130426/62442_1 /TAXON_ID=1034831 /ORGANISM="Rhizochromulina marina cf, Strain CCMP1243" /LENGTH=235 /DNA_ID=CAMNT_0006949277 /DNA_START=1 /DNA_END=705 /DNA_ORIENTATION=-